MARTRSHHPAALAVRLAVAGAVAGAAGLLASVPAFAAGLPGISVQVSPPALLAPPTAAPTPGPSRAPALQVGLGPLGTVQVIPTATPVPVVSLPPIAGICVTSCTSAPPPGAGPTPPPVTTKPTVVPPSANPLTTLHGVASVADLSNFPVAVPFSNASNASAQVIPGLHDTLPLPVQTLSAVPGISFGQAPYLWPIFLLLDLVAAVAVILVVRKTWSKSAQD